LEACLATLLQVQNVCSVERNVGGLYGLMLCIVGLLQRNGIDVWCGVIKQKQIELCKSKMLSRASETLMVVALTITRRDWLFSEVSSVECKDGVTR
jgi:hypothetical protein